MKALPALGLCGGLLLLQACYTAENSLAEVDTPSTKPSTVTTAAPQAPAKVAATIKPAKLQLSEHQQHDAEVFQYWCATCQGAGEGKPGTMALSFKYKDGEQPALLEQRSDLTPELLT